MGKKINLKEFYEGLDIMFSKKNTIDTENYMKTNLEIANNSDDIEAIIAINNEIGGFYRVTGKFQEAKDSYKTVIHCLEKINMSNTENYATALINFANVYIANKQFKEALELFEQAKVILVNCGYDKDYRMAALGNNISAVYRSLGEFKLAENALLEAFEIIVGIEDAKGELATTYVNLGQLQINQGDFSKAKKNLFESIKVFEEDGGIDIHFAMANSALGEVFYYEGNYVESEKYYEKALELIERDFGKIPSYEMILKNLEKVRKLKGS